MRARPGWGQVSVGGDRTFDEVARQGPHVLGVELGFVVESADRLNEPRRLGSEEVVAQRGDAGVPDGIPR
jgi:hypothetical protein